MRPEAMTIRLRRLTLVEVRRPRLLLLWEEVEPLRFGFTETTSNSWPRAATAQKMRRESRIDSFDARGRRMVGPALRIAGAEEEAGVGTEAAVGLAHIHEIVVALVAVADGVIRADAGGFQFTGERSLPAREFDAMEEYANAEVNGRANLQGLDAGDAADHEG